MNSILCYYVFCYASNAIFDCCCRGNWQSVDVPHSSGMSVTEHCDIFPSGLPLTSRKSSSSTDSSSCLSIHSRSTTSSSERGSASEASGIVSNCNLIFFIISIFMQY